MAPARPEPKAQVDTFTFVLQGQPPVLEKESFEGSLLEGEMGANPRWGGGALGLLPPISCFEFCPLEAFSGRVWCDVARD